MDKLIQSAKSTVSQFSQGLYKHNEQHTKFVENEALSSNPKPEDKPKEMPKVENADEIGSCFGGLAEDEARKLKQELDKAKESNSFSKSTRCQIS
jgi:hypothetical protein